MRKLLRPYQVRDRYKISRSTLWKWEKEGIIHPAKTCGGQRRYSTNEIETLLGIRKDNVDEQM